MASLLHPLAVEIDTLRLPPDSIPTAWEQVTPEWMTDAIGRDHPDAEVSKAELVFQDDGSNRRARFALTYSKGSGPATVFLKAHDAENRVTHLRNGNLWNEAGLFASGEPLPVEHPKVYKAIIDLLGLDFLLVMEDMKQRGADMRDATRPLTPEQTANGLKNLARLHSHYWGVSPRTHPKLAWLQTWEPTEGWQSGLRGFVPRGVERTQDILPASVRQFSPGEVVDLWARYVGTLAADPVTLTHGDLHVGNTYVLPNGDVGFLDWQVVRRGAWHQDLGHFMGSALTKEDRRAHEAELLEIYRDALTVPEGQKPTREEAWLIYRTTPAYGLAIWLSTMGTDGWQGWDICRTLSDRFAAAFDELDTLGAFAEAGI